MSDFLRFLPSGAAAELAEKPRGNEFLPFLHFLHSGAVKGEVVDPRERGKKAINAINLFFFTSLPPRAGFRSGRISAGPNSRPADARPCHRYFPRAVAFLTPAGTAAKHKTVCFACPNLGTP